jgi:hypothetical protein
MTGGGFKPGQSGNPAGRQKGQPNKLTRAVRERIASGADPIAFLQRIMMGEAISSADDAAGVVPTIEQRLRAAVSLANKLMPDAKDAPVKFNVPKIENPGDALVAMAAVTDAMNAGEVTPAEAHAVLSVIGTYVKAYETTELERRIKALEEARA